MLTDSNITRPRVKICGLTCQKDAEDAIAAGADALGFNAYPGSKRFIDLKREGGWIRSLPPFVTKVAVMVNPTLDEAEAAFALPYIDLVQFHGSEDEKFCEHFARLGLPFVKALAMKDEETIQRVTGYSTPYILIDAYSPDAFGGTGKLIEPSLLERFTTHRREGVHVILSGGLNPSNVANAVRQVHPYAVDVASGVEISPGRKSRDLMREFILAATGA